MELKTITIKGFSFLLVLLIVMGLSVTAFAAGSAVTFENGRVIALAPGSVYAGSDLFNSIKGVMPGDTVKEEITVENKSNDCDYIKVYMRAVLFDETGNPVSEKVLNELRADVRRNVTPELEYMYDFLAQLSMTVKNGPDVIYDASPDQLDGLANNVYLGTLRKGESLKLDVELNVPIDLGNEYANRIGEVGWVFVVEGFDDPVPTPTPTDPAKPDPGPPKTGEGRGTGQLIGLVFISISGLLLLSGIKRKLSKKPENN
jgi:hypothetical protein